MKTLSLIALKTLLLIAICLGSMSVSFGQDIPRSSKTDEPVKNEYERYRIVYDFQTQSFSMQKRTARNKKWKDMDSRKLRPAVNSFIHLSVINYNPIRDNLTLKYNFENLNLEGSQELLAALTRTPAAATEDKIDENSPEGETPKIKDEKGTHGLDIIVSSQICLDLKNFLNKVELADPTELDINKPTAYYEIAKSWENLTKGDLYSFATSEFDASKLNCAQVLKDSLKTYRENIKKLISLQQAYELKELSKSFTKELEDAKAAALAPDRNVLKAKLDNMIEEKTLLAKEKASSKESWEKLATKLTGKLQLIEASDKEAAIKNLAENGKTMDQAYDQMTNYSATTFAPIQMQDYDRINLTFLSKDKPLNATSYKFYSKSGWKIDFSTGFSINGLNRSTYYYDDIRNETIGVDTDGNDIVAKFGTIKKKTEAPDWGIAMLAHLYPRTGGIVQPAFTFGAQVDNDNVSFLAGVSALFGREQRLGLSGGFALGSSNDLKAGYTVDQEIRDDNVSQGGVISVVEDTRALSYFLSLSYNLGGVK
ncbi:MAG: hypothetical protein GC193_07300 [Cryomorphaceae bacterium]|nr:hypothetical protein [Cryomorphaceae bacterium]